MADTSDAFDALWANYFDAMEDVALPNGDVRVLLPYLRWLLARGINQRRLTGVRADLPDVSRGILWSARRPASRRGLHGYDVVSCDGARCLLISQRVRIGADAGSLLVRLTGTRRRC
jgi:hypothetical protein